MRNLNRQYGRITLDAYALRTFAGNGFGDAAIGDYQPHSVLDSIELYQQARTYRSQQLREIIRGVMQAAIDHGRRLIELWARHQLARATYRTLSRLDARTLRDLGFDRSELLSVAAEFAGCADSTRARVGRGR